MIFSRPTTEEELESILRVAYEHACRGRYDDALQLCEWLVADPTTRTAGLRERSAVKSHMGDIAGAIADLKAVLELNPQEPADFHTLGILLLKSGATSEAISCFSETIKIGKAANNHYYSQSAALFSAHAKLKVCDYEGAEQDLLTLPAGYRTHIPNEGIQSKEELMNKVRIAHERVSKTKFLFDKGK